VRRRRLIVLVAGMALAVSGLGVGGFLLWRRLGREDAGPVRRPPIPPPALASGVPRRAEILGDVEHGARMFAASCASCHGLEGRGDGPAMGLVRNPPRDFTDPTEMNARTDESLHRTIREGGHRVGRAWIMPAFGEEKDFLDAWDLVAYLRTLHVSVEDLLPDARVWEAHEVVLTLERAARIAADLGRPFPADRHRVVFFEARARTDGAAIAYVAFDRIGEAVVVAVAEDPSGRPLARRYFGSGAPPEAVEEAQVLLWQRLEHARAQEPEDVARAEARLARFRAQPNSFPPIERNYLASCADCHGALGSPLGNHLRRGEGAVPARNLADGSHMNRLTDEEIARTTREGGDAAGVSGQMPSHRFPDEELSALVAYLRTLAVPPPAGRCVCGVAGKPCEHASGEGGRCTCVEVAGAGERTCPALPQRGNGG